MQVDNVCPVAMVTMSSALLPDSEVASHIIKSLIYLGKVAKQTYPNLTQSNFTIPDLTYDPASHFPIWHWLMCGVDNSCSNSAITANKSSQRTDDLAESQVQC